MTNRGPVLENSTWQQLQPDERAYLELVLCDALGIAAAGSGAPGIDGMLAGLADLGGGEIQPAWTQLRVNVPTAAAVLSVLIHAWDFDDTHDEAVVHTASVVLPAALAVAQNSSQATGLDVLNGVVAGIQVLSRLSREMGPKTGVIRTAGLGALAAAAAAGTTLRLSNTQIESGIALALTSACSPATRQAVVDGSLAKRLQPALAVQTGVTAAMLAAHGVEGPSGWLNGPYGVLPGSDVTFADLFAGDFEGRGLALKPYPACRYTHAALAAAETALPRDATPQDIATIDVRVPSGEAYLLVSRPYEDRGSPVIDAQFSIAWQVAAIAVTGSYNLTTLAVSDLVRAEIGEFARRVHVAQDLPASTTMADAVVEVHTVDGQTRSHRSAMPGSAQQPLEWHQVADKIDSCLAVSGRAGTDSARIRDFVQSLETAGAGEMASRLATLQNASVTTENKG